MKIKRFLQGNSVCSSRFVPCLRVAWPVAVITVLCASAAWSEMILVPATEMAGQDCELLLLFGQLGTGHFANGRHE